MLCVVTLSTVRLGIWVAVAVVSSNMRKVPTVVLVDPEGEELAFFETESARAVSASDAWCQYSEIRSRPASL